MMFINGNSPINADGQSCANLRELWDGGSDFEFDWESPYVNGKLVDDLYDGKSFGEFIGALLDTRNQCRIAWNSTSGDGCHYTSVESNPQRLDQSVIEVVVRHVSLDGGGHGNLFDQPIMIVRGVYNRSTREWSDVMLCQSYDGPVAKFILADFE